MHKLVNSKITGYFVVKSIENKGILFLIRVYLNHSLNVVEDMASSPFFVLIKTCVHAHYWLRKHLVHYFFIFNPSRCNVLSLKDLGLWCRAGFYYIVGFCICYWCFCFVMDGCHCLLDWRMANKANAPC